MDPWSVSGIEFDTDAWTEIDPEIGQGSLVQVEGQILEDGTWLASEISLREEEDLGEGMVIEFVGRITGMDPWRVSGIPLQVDDGTKIKGNARLGVRVRVKAVVLPEGVLLAKEIKAVGFAYGHGCLNFSLIVAEVDDVQIRLTNGLVIPLDSVQIAGEIAPGSVIVLQACVQENGKITFVDVILVYQLDPDAVVLLPVPPPPEPAQPPQAPTGTDDVIICHKPGTPAEQTKVISASALQSHLDHGDTMGPCK
jgi:hypothetical protein